jgi:eukaryotic-like serine/threonine-protein kinase
VSSSNWQEIEEIFHTASTMEAEERSAYLNEVCSGKGELRKEVDSLLSAREDNNGFLEQPTVELGFEVLLEKARESMVDTQVGPYRILKALGRGGMGEVYLAEDTVLGRKVALKFLFGELVGDNWAKRQLIKEAQAAAMLDHPNICPIYGIEEHDGRSFIVMQYVEGDTLGELIKKGPIAPEQILTLVKQIVSAIAEAHSHGIIHRDIKPKNIMVTPSGQVKVLDFGLAKTIQAKQDSESITDSISHLSQSGLVPGTVAYMSPEQLRGEKLDYRSDIFSVGTLLYEMSTGKNPFSRNQNVEVISAILTLDVKTSSIASANGSKELSYVIARCLKKEKEDRYPSASELLLEIESVEKGINPRRERSYFSVRAAVALSVLLILVIASAVLYSRLTRKVHRLAVLPIICDGLSADTPCVGPELTRQLTDRLALQPDLNVVTSSIVPAPYGPSTISPQRIARSLNADTVLWGRIVKRGNSLLLITRFESVTTGVQYPDEESPLNPADTTAAQDEVALNATIYLQLQRAEDEKGKVAAVALSRNRNPAAVELYIRGRAYWDKRDRQNIDKAIELFTQAIELDPGYARAYARLAECYVLTVSPAYGTATSKEAMTKAEWAARQALEIDEMLPEVHTSLGVINMRYHWNWTEAEKEFKRAIEIDPKYAPAHFWYSSLLMIVKKPEESLRESEIARDIEPFSATVLMNLGRSYYRMKDYDKAAALLQKTMEDFPNNRRNAAYVLGFVYLLQGKNDEAIKIFEEIAAKEKWLAAAPLGYAYGKAGRRDDAYRLLAEMEEHEKEQHIPAQERAIIYLGLDDKDNAFLWLEKSYEERFPSIIYLTVEPMFDSLRSDPRFAELARKINVTV